MSFKVNSIKVKLSGPVIGDYISQGVVLVQIKQGDPWGYICSSDWSYANARVVCGQLGFPDAKKTMVEDSSQGRVRSMNDGKFIISGLKCNGTESSIVSCDHVGWGEHECARGGPVSVTCVRARRERVGHLQLNCCSEIRFFDNLIYFQWVTENCFNPFNASCIFQFSQPEPILFIEQI